MPRQSCVLTESFSGGETERHRSNFRSALDLEVLEPRFRGNEACVPNSHRNAVGDRDVFQSVLIEFPHDNRRSQSRPGTNLVLLCKRYRIAERRTQAVEYRSIASLKSMVGSKQSLNNSLPCPVTEQFIPNGDTNLPELGVGEFTAVPPVAHLLSYFKPASFQNFRPRIIDI